MKCGKVTKSETEHCGQSCLVEWEVSVLKSEHSTIDEYELSNFEASLLDDPASLNPAAKCVEKV